MAEGKKAGYDSHPFAFRRSLPDWMSPGQHGQDQPLLDSALRLPRENRCNRRYGEQVNAPMACLSETHYLDTSN
jgi:hypothetical protein